MRYLLALLIPPLSILLSGRPITAVLNLLFWVLGLLFAVVGLLVTWPLATLHALLLTHQDNADERNRALLAAVSGKPVPRQPKGEVRAIIFALPAIIIAFIVAFVIASLPPGYVIAIGSLRIPVTPAATAPPAATAAPAVTSSSPAASSLPSITGWTLQEVTSRHGPPLSTDKTTGLATWPTFTARFSSGLVQEVLPP